MSTFRGAFAGAGLNDARIETTGHNFTVLLPDGGAKAAPSYFVNAFNSLNSSLPIRINTYLVEDENWSEYSHCGRTTSSGSRGISETTIVKLKSDKLHGFTITVLKALSKVSSINRVMIGFAVGQNLNSRAVTVQVMMKTGGVPPSGYLTGLLASQTSSPISTFDITMR